MLPGPDELRETVEHLMEAYEELRARFAVDLGDERDELLSRGGALMLIHGAVGRAHGSA